MCHLTETDAKSLLFSSSGLCYVKFLYVSPEDEQGILLETSRPNPGSPQSQHSPKENYYMVKWCLKLCMVWRIRVTINININSELASTTMDKISLEGVGALKKKTGLVSTFRSVYTLIFLLRRAG